MEVLKHVHYKNLEIMVTRVEAQKEEILIDNEKTTIGITSIALPKIADNPNTASYSAKNVSIPTKNGDINFGIAITRSTK